MDKKSKELKKKICIIITISLLDAIFLITWTWNINWLLGFNIGFGFLILTIITSVFSRFKGLGIAEAVEVGLFSFLIRTLLSFPVLSLFGVSLNLDYLFILSFIVNNLVQGMSYGAFAGWLANKVIR